MFKIESRIQTINKITSVSPSGQSPQNPAKSVLIKFSDNSKSHQNPQISPLKHQKPLIYQAFLEVSSFSSKSTTHLTNITHPRSALIPR